MAEIIKATIQLRRATEAKWNEIGASFIPKEGEPCLTLDGENAGKVKYGDGINTWSNLSYSSGSGGEASEDGGFYTPEVTQPSDDTMRISFAASKGNMPPVEPVSVTLPAGPAGKDGEDGAPGQPGQDGIPGQDGFSPTASVTQTADGVKIAITDKSGTTNATITNGKDGTNGTDGQTPNITPGNIETLPAGSDVTASITGQTPNLVLNLGIPQGPAGAGVPPTDTAQVGDVPTWDGSNVVWAPPSGGGNDKSYELITTIEIREDGITSIERDLGADYESLLISNVEMYGLQLGSDQAIAKGNYPLRLYLRDKNRLVNGNEVTIISYNSTIHVADAKRYFFIIEKMAGIWRGIATREFTSGGWNLGSQDGLSLGVLIEQHYSTDYFNKLVLECVFANPVNLYVYGIPHQGGTA